MPLAELQTALARLVSAHAASGSLAPETLDELALSAEERAWLDSLPGAPGFRVTCDIQRWWRETRLRETARLTLVALGPQRAADLVQAFLNAAPCSTLFFLPEARAFLRFAAETLEDANLSAIARFEHALLVAGDAALQLAPDAPDFDEATEIVVFAAPPEELLDAVLHRHPLPAPSLEGFPVLISPRLPRLSQPI